MLCLEIWYMMVLVVLTAHLFGITMVLNSIQPVISGVAVGGGWQGLVAYINLACYYIFGLPLGFLLGYGLQWGVQGIWVGMLLGTALQTLILCYVLWKTNWEEELQCRAGYYCLMDPLVNKLSKIISDNTFKFSLSVWQDSTVKVDFSPRSQWRSPTSFRFSVSTAYGILLPNLIKLCTGDNIFVNVSKVHNF